MAVDKSWRGRILSLNKAMARTVLITGVSSGIGRVTAELMAQSGWQVAATSRDPAALAAWATERTIAVKP